MTKQEEKILLDWISNFKPIKTFNLKHTSYELKHIFERTEQGFYITNDEFKDAMLKAGFKVKDKSAVNWVLIFLRNPLILNVNKKTFILFKNIIRKISNRIF